MIKLSKRYKNLEELLLDYDKIPIGKAKDVTGIKINRITFICRVKPKNKSESAYWACQCECGIYFVARATHIIQEKTKSCGCYAVDIVPTANRVYTPNHENLVGKKFNMLTVKKYIGKDKASHAIWQCQCDCGKIINVTATHLKTGHTTSCGCTKTSQYERKINEWLLANNFIFEREVKYPELGILRFDFKINLPNGKYLLLEMQGQQHYKPNSKFGGKEAFKKLQENDRKKVEFCKKKNIPLLTIKYNENIEEILAKNLL